MILVIGAMLSILLVWTFRQNRKAYACVLNYCTKQGWTFQERRERLHNAFVIQTDKWRLTTGVEASESGVKNSPEDSTAYTHWENLPDAEQLCTLLWFGTFPKEAEMKMGHALLSAWGIGETQGLRVVPLDASLEGRFLAIAKEDPTLTNVGEGVSRLLADWPHDWPLRGCVGKKTVYLSVPGKRMEQPGELDRIIALGEGMVKWFSIADARPAQRMEQAKETG